MALLADTDPKNGRGIYAVIEVMCIDTNNIATLYQYKMWLPKSTFSAVKELTIRLNAHKIDGIEASKCKKHVRFYIKNVNPSNGFDFIINALKSANIDVEVVKENVV